MTPEERLSSLGIELPPVPAAAASYVGCVRVGALVFTAGHAPVDRGEVVYKGRLGDDLDLATGQRAARLAMLNVLATLKQELGELSRVDRVAKLLVMVSCTSEFDEHHLVANGASDLLTEVFGADRGPHARSAVGMRSLPLGISVEIEGVFAAA